jgi:hydrogenase-4 component B
LSELQVVFASSELALPFLAAIALVFPAVALWTLRRGHRSDLWLLALFAGAMACVLLARSVAAFAIAWEVMALVSAFLVAQHHERRYVRSATLWYLVVGQLGALCIFTALALLGTNAASFSFTVIAHAAPALPAVTRGWILALALVGFGSKAGLVPLHFWLPRAHPAAPANASAMLSGLMLAVAIYGLVLVTLRLAAPVPPVFAFVVLGIGLLSAFAGALCASVDADLKRLLAYSSIENVGVAVATLALALLARQYHQPAIAALALIALLFHIISHAVFKSLLFLVAGTVADAAGTTDLEMLGGLFRALRFTAPLALLGCAAASALPATSGFASEWLVFRAFMSALVTGPLALRIAAAVAITALAGSAGLAAVAYVKLYGIGFLGARRSTHRSEHESFDSAFTGLSWLGAIVVILGLAPELALRPLASVAQALEFAPPSLDGFPSLPLKLAVLPVAGALFVLWHARARIRSVPTWTCGSPVTHRSQYSASALSNPVALIFRSPLRIDIDGAARFIAEVVQRAAQRARIVQGGLLRVYLGYAALALAVILFVAR